TITHRRTSRWDKNRNINSDSDSALKTTLGHSLTRHQKSQHFSRSTATNIHGAHKTKGQNRFSVHVIIRNPAKSPCQHGKVRSPEMTSFPGKMTTERHLTEQDRKESQISQHSLTTLTCSNQDDRGTPFDGSTIPGTSTHSQDPKEQPTDINTPPLTASCIPILSSDLERSSTLAKHMTLTDRPFRYKELVFWCAYDAYVYAFEQ
ncbi:hypothetical protein VP01_636g1, partial [Puccinia sorghi]